MKKPYLLIAGDCYYPSSGTDDWKGCYETIEEIQEMLEKDPDDCPEGAVKIDGAPYDWYYIIDLREWVN